MKNRTVLNQSFSQAIIDQVWEKATKVRGYNPDVFRKDKHGVWINKAMFGDNSDQLSFGWEIDHIKPKNKNGTDDLSNLQPLHWQNNRNKNDDYPYSTCMVTSSGVKNVYA